MEGLTPDTQAALLLSSPLGTSDVKPLSLAEYNRLARQLVERNLRPADLITGTLDGYLIPPDRLSKLVTRGTALAIAVERWAQKGVRVVSRGETAYPPALRAKLKAGAAPVLFYSGSLGILASDAICAVGSRDASPSGLAFAVRLGRACAEQDFVVVSGDARGVDREAMQAALDQGGKAIGVLAETLATAVLAKRNRDLLMQGRLLLMSPFDPDSRFTVAHAMQRNRYLYALAKAAVIVDSDVKGGTWSGALENQKHRWTPAFVRTSADARPGNELLAADGLIPLPDSGGDLPPLRSMIEAASEAGSAQLRSRELPFDEVGTMTDSANAGSVEDASELFELFLSRLQTILDSGGVSEDMIAGHFGLEVTQARRWLEHPKAARVLQRSGGTERLVRLRHAGQH